MPIDDPATWVKAAGALKTAFEGFRQAIGLVKDVQSLGGGSKQQQEAISSALTVASSNAAIAEAEIALALGYQLCRCEFPPVAMKTVGYFDMSHPDAGKRTGDPVYECPKCGYSTAGPYMYQRIAPERSS